MKLLEPQLTIVQAHVHRLFKKVFEVNQDDDFATHECVLPTIARAYDSGDGDGPDSDDLHFDMIGRVNSRWNQAVFDILLTKLKDAKEEENSLLPNRSDDYLVNLIKKHYKRVATVWQRSQRKTNDLGDLETWDTVEQQLVAQKEVKLLANRHATRRCNVSKQLHRGSILVNLCSETHAAHTDRGIHDQAQS
jgi:hypothetical protein